MKDVMILMGAGQIGMAIARRMGYGIQLRMTIVRRKHKVKKERVRLC